MENKNNKLDVLKTNTDGIVEQLIESQDAEEIKRLTQLFNVNQMKKDAIRVIKLNDILDKLDNQVFERVEKHPEQFSNNDLLNYVNTIQQTINKSSQTISNIDQTPLIQLNQQNNIVNLNDDTSFSRESREKILSVVQQLLKQSENMPTTFNSTEDNVVYYDNDGEEHQ